MLGLCQPVAPRLESCLGPAGLNRRIPLRLVLLKMPRCAIIADPLTKTSHALWWDTQMASGVLVDLPYHFVVPDFLQNASITLEEWVSFSRFVDPPPGYTLEGCYLQYPQTHVSGLKYSII